jgi:hypothetical protein
VAPGSADHRRAAELLSDRYPQYADDPPAGPAIVISVLRWTGWRYDHTEAQKS